MAGLRISAFSSAEIQAVIAGMTRLPTEVRKDIRVQNKRVIPEVWKESIGAVNADFLQQAVLVRTATVTIRDTNVILNSGGKGSLRKVVPPRAVEFGADREIKVTYQSRSRKGTPYRETRRTQRQLPPFKPTGWVVYPAAADAIPRIASLWVQTTLRAFHELLKAGLF